MTQSSDKPAPLPAPRPVILAEGSVVAVQRFRKATLRRRERKTSVCRRSMLMQRLTWATLCCWRSTAALTRPTRSRTEIENGPAMPTIQIEQDNPDVFADVRARIADLTENVRKAREKSDMWRIVDYSRAHAYTHGYLLGLHKNGLLSWAAYQEMKGEMDQTDRAAGWTSSE